MRKRLGLRNGFNTKSSSSSSGVQLSWLARLKTGMGNSWAGSRADDRRILIRLVSTALTGFFYTTSKQRILPKLALRKYDPIGQWIPAPIAGSSPSRRCSAGVDHHAILVAMRYQR